VVYNLNSDCKKDQGIPDGETKITQTCWLLVISCVKRKRMWTLLLFYCLPV